MSGHALLEAREVTVRFGGLTAVDAVSVAFAPGKARPWSVVQTISVRSVSPKSWSALSTAPTPWSSERALALKAAMSRRVAGVSGRFAGGRE